MIAWLVQFLLLLNSWVWVSTPQSLVTNIILCVMYASVLGVQYFLHVYKVEACLTELHRRAAGEEKKRQTFTMESKVIGDYLAGHYAQLSSDVDAGSISMGETNMSTITAGLSEKEGPGSQRDGEEGLTIDRSDSMANANQSRKRFILREKSLFD